MNTNLELPKGVTVLEPNWMFDWNTDIDYRLANFLEKKLKNNEKYTYKELIELPLGTKKNPTIGLPNCVYHSLKFAVLSKDKLLIRAIIEATSFKYVNKCPKGYNSLLFILPLGSLAHSAVIQLVNAGAYINGALGYHNEKCTDLKNIPLHATPLYIAAEHTKYLPTVCFLERMGAICYPQPTEEAQNLINKARWLNNSGFQFYMGGLLCQDFALNKSGIPMDVTKCIIQTCDNML